MEMGVRRAEAARRQASVGSGRHGEGAPPSSDPASTLELPAPTVLSEEPTSLLPPAQLKKIQAEGCPTLFYRAGHGSQEGGCPKPQRKAGANHGCPNLSEVPCPVAPASPTSVLKHQSVSS